MPGGGEVVEGPLGVRVVQGDPVDDETERGELLFLALVVGLPQLAAAAVEDLAGERVAGLAAVELRKKPPAQRLEKALEEVRSAGSRRRAGASANGSFTQQRRTQKAENERTVATCRFHVAGAQPPHASTTARSSFRPQTHSNGRSEPGPAQRSRCSRPRVCA